MKKRYLPAIVLGSVGVITAFSSVASYASAGAAQLPTASNQASTQTQTKTLVINEKLSELNRRAYGSTTQSEANQQIDSSWTKVLGVDNYKNINNAIMHLNLKTTSDQVGDSSDSLDGFLQIANQHFTISTDKSVVPETVPLRAGTKLKDGTTLNDGSTIVQDVFDGTLQGKDKSWPIVIGVTYIPNTDNLQVSMTVEGTGYSISGIFGKLFISDDMAKQELAGSGATSAQTVQPMSTTCFSGSNDWTNRTHGYLTTMDGNDIGIHTMGMDTSSYLADSSGHTYLRVSTWGTTDAENWAGNSNGFYTGVSNVHFAASTAGDFSMDSATCPDAESSTYSLSALNWFAWVPEIGELLAFAANASVTVDTIKSYGSSYTYNEKQWNGPNQDYVYSSSVTYPSSDETYTEEFRSYDSAVGHNWNGDAGIDYQTFGPTGGWTFHKTGWKYTTANIN